MGTPERLVEIREDHGYTRRRLAEELGKPYTTITKYETGEREPGHAYIVEIAKKFGVTTDYILGLSDDATAKVSLSMTKREADHIKKYRALDEHGKEMVSLTLDCETRRMDAAKEKTVPAGPRMKVIPLLGNSFAAGRGDPDFGNPWEDYEVPADSKGEFAVRINGDSMEPWLPDGSIALGVKRAPRDGEVAALLVDGEFLCKQVCQDIVGNLYLFALNRKRKDADQTIASDSERSVSCFGTILMERVPLPTDV